jgi:hypothetical protein
MKNDTLRSEISKLADVPYLKEAMKDGANKVAKVYTDTRPRLFEHAGSQNYPEIVATARGARAAAIWMQQPGLLPQFSLGLEA